MMRRSIAGIVCRTAFLAAPVWVTLTGAAGCGFDLLLNQASSFGPSGSDATAGATIGSGQRGSFNVVIENNTPYRAVFTYGVFDNTDTESAPVFFQYAPDSPRRPPPAQASLEANETSPVVGLPCARVFSIGGDGLIGRILENETGAIDDRALTRGVAFSSRPLDGGTPDDDPYDADQGFAPAFEALLGADFNCGALLHVTLEFDDAGDAPFRVGMRVYPARNAP